MKMHLDTSSNNLVSDYGEGYICVNGVRYQQSLVLSSDKLSADWQSESVADLTLEDFGTVLQQRPEIILLGTGKTHAFPNQQLRAALSAHGSALEVMTTSAACRTYNVLVSEYRNVTAVLLQIRP